MPISVGRAPAIDLQDGLHRGEAFRLRPQREPRVAFPRAGPALQIVPSACRHLGEDRIEGAGLRDEDVPQRLHGIGPLAIMRPETGRAEGMLRLQRSGVRGGGKRLQMLCRPSARGGESLAGEGRNGKNKKRTNWNYGGVGMADAKSP